MNQGGVSRITYLQKITDGTIFSESFENDNFINAESWTTLQGTPANTSAQFKQGIKSWDNTATSQSLPVAQKTISYIPGATQNQYFIIWFYDDVSHTTEDGPYVKLQLSTGKYISIGVRNSVSTTRYSYLPLNASGDQPTTSTGVPRTTGWHSFKVITNTTTTGVLGMQVDNTLFVNAPGDSGYITNIFVQANTVGGTGNSFGYFDGLGLFKDSSFFINPPDSFLYNAGFYDSTNTLFTINTASSQMGSSLPTNVFSSYPATIFMLFSNNTGPKFSYRTPSVLVNPGDVYQLQVISFPTRFRTFQTDDMSLMNQSQTLGGVRDVTTFGIKNKNTFTYEQSTTSTFRQKADNFFYYVRQGFPFSLTVDDINESAMGVIKGFFVSGSSRVLINSNLDTNSTDSFTSGNLYVVQKQDNSDRQTVSLSTKDTNTLTFVENLNFDVNSGDYVYSQFNFPFQEFPNQDMPGLQLVDPQNERYTWTLPTQDYIDPNV